MLLSKLLLSVMFFVKTDVSDVVDASSNVVVAFSDVDDASDVVVKTDAFSCVVMKTDAFSDAAVKTTAFGDFVVKTNVE